MAVEMAGLSNFKLQLLALISEARHLRERERGFRDELHRSDERQRQTGVEYGSKLQELRTELASRDNLIHKLESKVQYLEHENIMLENKEKELKDSMNSLLQSRDTFISNYENSTYTLRQAIEARDRKLSVLSEKMGAHSLLFDLVEKETAAVKETVDKVQHLVNEKEHIVAELKVKMDKISLFEKEFVEKICSLEKKLRGYQHEIRRRNAMIFELKEHLETQTVNSNFQPEIEELQKALLVKDEMIQSLTSDKQALHLELKTVELSLHKIEDIVANMSSEKASSPAMVVQGVCERISREENESLEIIIHATEEDSSNKNTIGCTTKTSAELLHEEHTAGEETSCKKNILNQCLPKGFNPPVVTHFDSEGSTTGGKA